MARKRSTRRRSRRHGGGKRKSYGLVLKDAVVPVFYVLLNNQYKQAGAVRNVLRKAGISFKPVAKLGKSLFSKKRSRRRGRSRRPGRSRTRGRRRSRRR